MNEDFNNLFGDDMDDEEFRRLFTRIMNQRQKQMERFLRMFYGNMGINPLDLPQSPSSRSNDLSGRTPSEPSDDTYDMFRRMFGNIDMGNPEIDENGWETRSWTSPDGSMSFSSSSRVFSMDPDEAERVFGDNFGKKEDSIEVLTQKMNKAIAEERYEDAAGFRDDIKALEEKRRNDENSEK